MLLLLLGGAPAPVVPPEVETGRDDAVMMAAAALLEATGAFQRVIPGCGPDDDQGPGGDRVAGVVWLDLEGWEEQTDGDADATVDTLHRAAMLVWIEVRSDDPIKAIQRVSRLEAVVQNAIDGVSIGDITYPALTMCRKSRRDRTVREPNRRHVMMVEWAYPLESYAGHDEADIEDF